MYKLYYPKELLFENSRSSLFPLLKPFIKGQDYTDEERISQYGVSEKTFCFVNYIQQADFVIIPMTWNYYRKNNLFKKVLRFIYSNRLMFKYLRIKLRIFIKNFPIPIIFIILYIMTHQIL